VSALDAERRGAVALAALLLAFKLWLSGFLPVTSDEAYFVIWGWLPEWGYYDHPPMVGWMHALLTRLSMSPWVLRLPTTLLPVAVALGIFWTLRERAPRNALYASVAFLLVPVNAWNIFVTTDTPLVLFCVLATLARWKALQEQSTAWHFLAGVLLGLALLSKYFAVLLALVFVADALLAPRSERRWRGLAAAFAGALPFMMVNAWWNYENCWANLMFNLYNRHEEAGLSWRTPLLFALIAAYVLSPLALLQAARAAALVRQRWQQDRGFRFLSLAAAVPFGFFAAVSVVRPVGLHWVLAFVPFFYLAAALLLSARQMRATTVYLGLFSLLHVAVVLALAALPLETWNRTRIYDGLVLHFRVNDVVRWLERHRPSFELAADGYSPAATLTYYSGRYVFVFGTGSSHARHDDLVTDMRRYDGRDIAIFRKNPPEASEYQPFFKSVEFRALTLSGAQFHLVLGRGFDYAAYRERVLVYVRDRYYRIPAYLPQGGCVFCERYFSAYCPVRGR
jgi:4-amino-4-deoxy-L-arabinose transferase-like glycosyltransferase